MLREESIGVEGRWCGVGGAGARSAKCEQLHRRLRRIVKARGALEAQEAEALREAEQLRVWRYYGYGSLLEYMEMEMGYSPRAALERLRVAKAIVGLPAIADAMAQGDLSFSAGRELTRVATAETEQEWLAAIGDKNLRDVEDMVSGRKPGDKPSDPADPALRRRRLRYDDIDDETIAMLRQAREILDRELGERMSDRDFLRTFARMVIDGAASPERKHAPYEVAVTICDDCKRGWQHGGAIKVEMSPATLEAALCDARHIGSLHDDAQGRDAHADNAFMDQAQGRDTRTDNASTADAQRATNKASTDSAQRATNKSCARATTRSVSKRVRSAIPPALRRKVKHRDHGRCRVPWCRSSRNCDQHHLLPLSHGGRHTEDNLITLCESHHLAHHTGALIIEGTRAATVVFKRRAHHEFAIAERAVETASALKSLGFDKHEVKIAMDKTRTHVGTSELTLEQWIKTALHYCAKPS
jgi:hypothetical protein